MASRRQLSPETVNVAAELVNTELATKLKSGKATPEEMDSLFTARRELTALGAKFSGSTQPKPRKARASTSATTTGGNVGTVTPEDVAQ